jgi:hypothetical protein
VTHNSSGATAASLLATAPWSNLPESSNIRSLLSVWGQTGPIPSLASGVHNVIVQAWEPLPTGILSEPRVRFDITRRADSMTRAVTSTGFVDDQFKTFPDLLDQANDEIEGGER